MHQLTYELCQLTRTHKESSLATRTRRRHELARIGDQLVAAGYGRMHPEELGGRHVQALLTLWRRQGLAPMTIKNRLAVLRWWSRKVGRPGVVATRNAVYQLPAHMPAFRRPYQPGPDARLRQVRNQRVRLSLELQRVFGLPRETALKLKPWQADRGDTLVLEAAWTPGKAARQLPIRTPAQREVLDRVQTVIRLRTASMVPPGTLFTQQVRRFERECRRAGIDPREGFRPVYVQERYLALTGWPCRAAGGPQVQDLSPAHQQADAAARLQISVELGHSHPALVAPLLEGYGQPGRRARLG